MLFDSHAHLDFVEDLEGTLARAKEAGLGKIVTIGTSVACSKKCIEIAEKYSDSDLAIFATCGIHPEDGRTDIEKFGSIAGAIDELGKLTKTSDRVVGIGECGLDYFVGNSSQRPETRDKDKKFQRELFSAQIKLASDSGLPLIVHCRNAWEEIFDFVKQGQFLNGVFHSWTGNLEAMQKAIDLGFYISFSGIVTFKNAKDIQEAAKKAPIERILVETDSPFLSPEPLRTEYYKSDKRNPTSSSQTRLRGAHMRNEPKNVKITADFISSLRGSSLSEISDITTRNAGEAFRI